jgi:LPXTG-motif cell wall-anchored protein
MTFDSFFNSAAIGTSLLIIGTVIFLLFKKKN